MNLEEYTLNKRHLIDSKIDDLKSCKNLNIFGMIFSAIGTTGAFILSRNETPNSITRYVLDVLVVFGVSMFILNAKDLCNNEKELEEYETKGIKTKIK